MSVISAQHAAQRRAANFFRDTGTDDRYTALLAADKGRSDQLTDSERATAKPIIEAKVEELAANLPTKAKALIVSAALQNPSLAHQMRSGGIGFSSSIVQSAVQSAMSDVQAGKITEANIHARRTDPDAAETGAGFPGRRHGVIPTAFEVMDREMRRRTASSSRFDILAGGEQLSHSDLQNMASARAAAVSLGMPWALNNPELLKLGEGAIKTLHDAGVQKERFERMTGDKVGFRAATAVDIAAFAKRHNLTPDQTNRLYDKINDGVEIISGGDKAIQRELDVATDRYVTGSDTPEARKALEEAYHRHADTPEKREAADRTTKALEEAAQQTQAKVLKADEKDVKAEEKVVKKAAAIATNDDVIAGLNDPQPPQTDPPKPVATATAAKAPVTSAPKVPAPKQ